LSVDWLAKCNSEDMSNSWESHLERWTAAGVVDASVRDRILAWEAEHREPQGLRWPTWIALAFGAILLGAGVLLFVSAHWDHMPASSRMTLVVAMVALFHFGGAVSADLFESLSIPLHTVGTVALGGAIALAGQIFNLSEHWPAAIMLWALGAALAWALLCHWTQAALTAILVPYWLAGEWWTMAEEHKFWMLPVSVGVCALSFAYLSARRGPDDSALRKALGWIGGIALLPAAIAVGVESWGSTTTHAWQPETLAWAIAILGPMSLAVALRRRQAVWVGVATVWTLLLAAANSGHGDHLLIYLWCAVGSAGLAMWGTRDSRPERINLGILGFGVTVLAFYFSNVMDKLDRATGLIVVGLLFLGGGWALERTRRRLMAHIQQEAI
jgi:uncharacterized membrane protein